MEGMAATGMTEKQSTEESTPRARDKRRPTDKGGTRPASRRPTGRRTQKQLIGQAAEDIAADFLRAKGLEILERNYRRRLGELDIVARDRGVLVIAEVRTRATDRYGGAAASVDPRKQQRIIRAARAVLQG